MSTVIYARENVDCEWTLFVADESGAPIDLTGCELFMACALPTDPLDDPAILLETVETAVEGLRIVDATGGEVQGLIPAATLQAVPDTTGAFTLKYDVVVERGDGSRFLVDEGEIRVTQGVTYPPEA